MRSRATWRWMLVPATVITVTVVVVLVPYGVDPFSIPVSNTDRTTGGGDGTIRHRMAYPLRSSNTVDIIESWRLNSTRIDDTGNDDDDDTMASFPSLRLSSAEQQTSRHMLLLSLRWSELVHHGSSSSNSHASFSKIVYDIWKWKDLVLGDGRDYFLPKSNTLRALQNYVIQNAKYCTDTTLMPNSTIPSYTISECVILSNCARFEIMMVVDTAATMTVDETTLHQPISPDRIVSDVSMLLYAQVQSYLQHRRDNLNIFAASTSFLDRPNDIDMNAMMKLLQPNGGVLPDVTRQIQGMHKHWNVLSNVTDIISHLCAIAVGIASRPRRPDRIVPFRPFSSRDAHILLQFKRTTDIATFGTKRDVSDENGSNNRLLLLLQYAIRAGKAARNPQRVPLLNTLRQQYGETGNSNKYDMVPPAHVMEQVLQSVHELVIHPTIHECVCHFNTMIESSTTKRSIQSLRHGALAMATTGEERHYILTQLHGPTMELRRRQQLGNDQEYGSNVEEEDSTLLLVRRTPVVWNETQFLEELRWNLTVLRQPQREKEPAVDVGE